MNNCLAIRILTLLILLSSIVIVLDKMYGIYIDSMFKIALQSDYVYYLPSSVILLALFILILSKGGGITGVNIIRQVLFILLFSISILLYIVSDTAINYILELKILSIIFLIWSLLSLVYYSKSILLSSLLLLMLLLLIPIPHHILFKTSMVYTDAVTAITVAVMNTAIHHSFDNVVLEFIDQVGLWRTYEIDFIGINSLTIIFVIAPIIGYIISYIRASRIEKILLFISVLWISSVIVLLGDSLRILLATFIGKWNYELGSLLIQQISSIPSITLAILTPIYLITRRPLVKQYPREDTIIGETVNRRWIISIVLIVMTAIAYPFITSNILHEVLLSNYSIIREFPHNLNDHIIAECDINSCEPFLDLDIGNNGLIRKECILIKYRGYNLRGYIEEAYEPENFMPWPIPIMIQGYLVINKWIEISNVSVTYMLISKSGHYLLLAYTTYIYSSNLHDASNNIYVRVTLFTEVNLDNYKEASLAIRELLNNVDLLESGNNRFTTNYLDIIGYLTFISMLLSIITLILINSNKLLSYIVKHTRRGRS